MAVPVWTFACEKGGVGKTSVAATVAEASALRGTRTLLVDLDPQGNASRRLLGMGETDLVSWVYEGPSVLAALSATERGAAAEQIVKTGDEWPGELYLLASPGAELTAFEERRSTAAADRRLARALNNLHLHGFGMVVVDTAPSLGLLTHNGMTAATEVVIVASPTGAKQGVAETQISAKLLAEEYDCSVRGLVITAVPNSPTKAESQGLEHYAGEWGEQILARIPKAGVWGTAEAEGRPLSAYVQEWGRGPHAQAALAHVEQILPEQKVDA